MAGFAFRLELEDGTPADPPTLHMGRTELGRRHDPAWLGQDAPRRRDAFVDEDPVLVAERT